MSETGVAGAFYLNMIIVNTAPASLKRGAGISDPIRAWQVTPHGPRLLLFVANTRPFWG
jgi:hypothetical protein